MFLDLDSNVAGVDRLYVADGTAGITKWNLATTGGTWTLAGTFTIAAPTGFRAVTAFVTGADVTVIGTTAQFAGTRIVRYVDTGTGTPTGTVILTASASGPAQGYRGIAPAPVLP